MLLSSLDRKQTVLLQQSVLSVKIGPSNVKPLAKQGPALTLCY
jgi:hypothetical protein